MAITTISQLRQGKQPDLVLFKTTSITTSVGIFHSSWVHSGGIPGSNYTPSNTVSGSARSYTGANTEISWRNPPAGANSYLFSAFNSSDVHASALYTNKPTIVVIDRVWDQSGVHVANNGTQTINSATFAARDNNGSANGEGIIPALFVTSTLGTTVGAGVPIISYTNSDGISGRTGTISVGASSSANRVYLFALQNGDNGVRSIESFNWTTAPTTGTCYLFAFRVLGIIEQDYVNGSVLDPFVFGMTKIENDPVIQFLYWTKVTTGFTPRLRLNVSQG